MPALYDLAWSIALFALVIGVIFLVRAVLVGRLRKANAYAEGHSATRTTDQRTSRDS